MDVANQEHFYCICVYCSMKRLVGYDPENDESDSDKLRHHILGGHVADYMRQMMEDDEEKYKSHFSRFIKEGVTADNVSEEEKKWRVLILCPLLMVELDGADV